MKMRQIFLRQDQSKDSGQIAKESTRNSKHSPKITTNSSEDGKKSVKKLLKKSGLALMARARSKLKEIHENGALNVVYIELSSFSPISYF
jgi:hypothetical protein